MTDEREPWQPAKIVLTGGREIPIEVGDLWAVGAGGYHRLVRVPFEHGIQVFDGGHGDAVVFWESTQDHRGLYVME